MRKESRLDRHKIFKEFQEKSITIFTEFKNEKGKHKKFDDYYMLSICPKGRNGGVSNRLVEVFYGNRPFDTEIKIKSNLEIQEKYIIEHGTTLSFNLNDHGYVAIMLHPSGTEYTQSIESTIFVTNYTHPKKLRDKAFLKKQWSLLNSYMEFTSIDGYPTLKDRITCWYLRYCKNLVIDGKFNQRKITKHFSNILKTTLTVGLSGFIIFIFTVWPNRKDQSVHIKENEQLKEINQSLNKIIDQKKNLIEDNNYSFSNDSIPL
jgi:hypothetical protein